MARDSRDLIVSTINAITQTMILRARLIAGSCSGVQGASSSTPDHSDFAERRLVYVRRKPVGVYKLIVIINRIAIWALVYERAYALCVRVKRAKALDTMKMAAETRY